MDEMTMIREFLAEPSPPGPHEVAAARGRLVKRIGGRGLLPRPGRRLARGARGGRRLARGARGGRRLARGARGGRRLARGARGGRRLAPRAAFGVAITCAAAALVIATLVTDTAPNGPVQTGAGPVAALTGQPAREFLLAMATKAGHSQVSSPTTGRYWCSQAISGNRELVGPDDTLLPSPWLHSAQRASTATPADYRYAIFTRQLEEDCLENPRPGWPGGTVGGFYQPLGARPASPADAAAWRRAGSPDRWKEWYAPQTVSGQPSPRQPTGSKTGQEPWGSDAALPASPAKLKAVFLAHPLSSFFASSPAQTRPTRDQELTMAALQVMNGPVTPAVRAAAFQVLADVPGIVMKPGVRDPEGRIGTAVWLIGNGQEAEWSVVDPATGSLLDYEQVTLRPVAGAPAYSVLDYTAFVSAHWTNTPPPTD
jgi:hypothetical protein